MSTAKIQAHPFTLFWLGVLTGALVTGLLFLYRLYAVDMEASVLRNYYVPSTNLRGVETMVSNPLLTNPLDEVATGTPPTF
jgi:hypothetical protein